MSRGVFALPNKSLSSLGAASHTYFVYDIPIHMALAWDLNL